MKIDFPLFVFFLLFCPLLVSSQIIDTIHAPATTQAKMFVNNKKLPAQSLTSPVSIDPKTVAAQKKWDVTFSQHGVSHGSEIPKNLMDSIKHIGSLLRKNQALMLQDTVKEEMPPKSGLAVTPVIGIGFKGNKYDYWTPPDNHMAVSDDGFVVSVINSSLFFSDENGNILMDENFNDFLSFLDLPGGYFDPRVIYDPVEDKFIIVVLNGNTPATSKVVIGFSTSGNPNETWWFYTFSGDPTGSNLWLDYPSIGISADDLYISGNQFVANGNFSQALIYQLEKGPGFTGGVVDGIHWYGVQDANGINDFTIVPVSHGFNTSVGPGIYFISTDGTGGSEAMMYYTDANSKNNPHLFVYSVDMPNYYTPFNGIMKGTTDELMTNDSKTQSAFYADGTIHFVFDNRGDDFHTKINYCRLNTSNLTQNTISIGQQPFEFAYPSIAPFTTSPTDKTVLIGFLRTSGSIYPEFRMAVVDNDMNYSGSFPVKEGESYVNFAAGTKERWGDYTGISRRHSANGAEVWISGCYGKDSDNGASNILCTWIAKVTDGQAGAAPVANFSANQTAITAGQSVSFTDQSTNSPTSWTWTFPGGTPANSTVKNPVVTYNIPGTYAVTLVAANNVGNDSETKAAYITVNSAQLPPVANFGANQTAITAGQSVSFTDQSTNSPTSWTWSFPGGMPSNATVKNPVVTYNTPGTYAVTLVAANNAGNDSETKAAYIKVNPSVLPPVADFTSDVVSVTPGGIVTFEDLSANTPASWQWSFPGGLPDASSLQNPIIVYPSSGCFDVTLSVANTAGNHTVTKHCYVDVLTTAVQEKSAVFGRFTVFPNPVSNGRLNLEFEIGQSAELDFYVVDNRGTVIKNLLHRRVKEGLNNLAFSTDPLVAGTYYLVVQGERNSLFRSEKFIVGQ